jgi:hypothetical protein
MSSMRSSVKRKIRPREDIMEQSFTEVILEGIVDEETKEEEEIF